MTTPTDPRDDQARIPQQQSQGAPADVVAAGPVRRPRRWPLFAAVAAVVVLAGAGITYALLPSTADKAVEACQDIVTERLRSPSTAQFAEPTVEERGRDGDTFVVKGQVDSQNGFGAMVRTTYSCDLYTPDGGKTWDDNGIQLN